MNKGVAFILLVLMVMGVAMTGCKSWSPSKETGTCGYDRQWIEPQQDPETGKWTDGRCDWEPGKAR